MQRFDVKLNDHYPSGVFCKGSGELSSNQSVIKDVRKGWIKVDKIPFAVCPICRREIPGSIVREVPSFGGQIKEFFSRRVRA